MFFTDRLAVNRQIYLCYILSLLLLLSGCGTLSNGKRWGEDVTLRPGLNKVGTSASNALTSPAFYLPAAAALLLQVEHADSRISDWAREHTPVYGSNRKAEDRSNDIRSITAYIMYSTMLATPSGNEPVPWGTSKAKGILVQYGAVGVSHFFISNLKDVTGRDRPTHIDDRSFPAGKTPSATAFTTISYRNIDTMNLSPPVKTTLNIGLYTILAAEGWSQVEAGSHFPADVLAGISIAYFITACLNDSFMGLDAEMQGTPIAEINGKNLFIGYCWRF